MAGGTRIWRRIAWAVATPVVLAILAVIVLSVLNAREGTESKRQASRRADAAAADYARQLADRLSRGPIARNDSSMPRVERITVYSTYQSGVSAQVGFDVLRVGDGIAGAIVIRCYVVTVNGVGRPNPQYTLRTLPACPAPSHSQ